MSNPDSTPRYADPNEDPRYAGPERTCGLCKFCLLPRDVGYCLRDVIVAGDPDEAPVYEVDPDDEGCKHWERSKWV